MPSLFICLTPLQILIAEHLIAVKKIKNATVIILAYQNNKKYDFYYQKIKLSAVRVIRVNVIPKNTLTTIFYFFKLLLIVKLKLRKNIFEDVYIASIDNKYIHFIMSFISFHKLYTFDDGTANIIATSSYYIETSVSDNAKEKILAFLGVKYNMNIIKKNICEHYTLYDGLPNIVNQTKFLALFPHQECNLKNNGKFIRIFIGQPLEESEVSFRVLKEFFDEFHIDYYFPHPRESNLEKLHLPKIIHTDQIIEDYIKSSLNNNPEINFEVYGLISTSILNLANMSQRIKVMCFYNDLLMNKYADYYKIVQKYGVSIYKI